MAGKKIRDVIYGFVELDEQECEIINHPSFQRLRRIKQLSLTDMVYPGACHTRFEHSIGVMHMETDMYDCIIKKYAKFLHEEGFVEAGFDKFKKIVRLAALLHDVGHAPFSHSGEDLMPQKEGETKGTRYEHEEYSIAIIKAVFRDIIENHKINNNYGIMAEDVTALLGDKSVKLKFGHILWKPLISGQVDADRADYLIRDSIHLGVSYGLYDRNRLVNGMALGKDETENLVIGIEDKSWHVAESLVLARYQMFTQVYFHKIRRIYDYHIYKATKEILKNLDFEDGCYPPPTRIGEYLKMDDWAIYEALRNGKGGEHGRIILERDHYKCIDETQEIPSENDEIRFAELEKQWTGSNFYIDDKANKSWYSLDKDILVYDKNGHSVVLSDKSTIVNSMREKTRQKRFYLDRRGKLE